MPLDLSQVSFRVRSTCACVHSRAQASVLNLSPLVKGLSTTDAHVIQPYMQGMQYVLCAGSDGRVAHSHATSQLYVPG